MLTKNDITKVIATLTALFPSFRLQVSPQQMRDAYHVVLSDLDRDQLMAAAVQFASNHTFFPSAGELRQAYFEIQDTATGRPTAEDAWAEVTRAMGKGFWDGSKGWLEARSPRAEDWSDPTIQLAIDAMGGWGELRRSDNPVADRAHFRKAYESYQRRSQEIERMPALVRQRVEALATGMRRAQLGEGAK